MQPMDVDEESYVTPRPLERPSQDELADDVQMNSKQSLIIGTVDNPMPIAWLQTGDDYRTVIDPSCVELSKYGTQLPKYVVHVWFKKRGLGLPVIREAMRITRNRSISVVAVNGSIVGTHVPKHIVLHIEPIRHRPASNMDRHVSVYRSLNCVKLLNTATVEKRIYYDPDLYEGMYDGNGAGSTRVIGTILSSAECNTSLVTQQTHLLRFSELAIVPVLVTKIDCVDGTMERPRIGFVTGPKSNTCAVQSSSAVPLSENSVFFDNIINVTFNPLEGRAVIPFLPGSQLYLNEKTWSEYKDIDMTKTRDLVALVRISNRIIIVKDEVVLCNLLKQDDFYFVYTIYSGIDRKCEVNSSDFRLNTLGVTGGKDLVSYEAARVQQNYSSDDEMDAKDMIGTLEVNNLEDILIYGADTMGSQRARYFQLKQGLIQSEYESSRQLAPHRKKVIAVLMEFIDHKEIVLLIVNVFDNMFQRYCAMPRFYGPGSNHLERNLRIIALTSLSTILGGDESGRLLFSVKDQERRLLFDNPARVAGRSVPIVVSDTFVVYYGIVNHFDGESGKISGRTVMAISANNVWDTIYDTILAVVGTSGVFQHSKWFDECTTEKKNLDLLREHGWYKNVVISPSNSRETATMLKSAGYTFSELVLIFYGTEAIRGGVLGYGFMNSVRISDVVLSFKDLETEDRDFSKDTFIAWA